MKAQRRNFMVNLGKFCFAFASIGVASCRAPEESKSGGDVQNIGVVKSAGNSVRDNDIKGGCGAGDPNVKGELVGRSAARAYSALPQQIRQQFDFLSQYRFFAEGEFNKYCSSAVSAAKSALKGAQNVASDSSITKGCWALSEDGKKPIIYIERSPAAVHNNLLALTAYAFFDFYVDGPKSVLEARKETRATDGTSLTAEESGLLDSLNAISVQRTEAAQQMVDLMKADEKLRKNLDVYVGKLGVKDYAGLVKNVTFQNFVISEFVDSYYCNAKTQATFQSEGLGALLTSPKFTLFTKEFGHAWFDKPPK